MTELSRCCAVVTAAPTAAEALPLVTLTRPDALISDIGMAGMDGYALIKALPALPADQGGKTPAIALTAYAGSQDRARLPGRLSGALGQAHRL